MLKNRPSRARVTALPRSAKDQAPIFESRAHARKDFFVFERPQHPNKKSVKHRANRDQKPNLFGLWRGAADVAATKSAKLVRGESKAKFTSALPNRSRCCRREAAETRA